MLLFVQLCSAILSLRFQSTEHHARHAVQLRKNNNVLAFPQYLCGNTAIPEEVINTVTAFYQEDGISRMSANSKDVIRINQKAESVRFMEMTVPDAFRQFDKRNPGLVGLSVFYSLRLRNVKIVSLHETCMCIYHENMHLLLKVHGICNFLLLNTSKFLIGVGRRVQTRMGETLHFNSQDIYCG